MAKTSYRNKCGGCHFCFPPGLLPAQTRQPVMGSPSQHFGDDAGLVLTRAKTLRVCVRVAVSSRCNWPRFRGLSPGPSPGERPPHIEQTLYFQRTNREVPTRPVTGDPRAGSF